MKKQLKMRTQHSQRHSTLNNIRLKVRQYDPDFKKKVAIFAERRGNQEAKRRFGVNESNIRRWKKIYKENVAEKTVVPNTVGSKNSKRKAAVNEDVPSIIGMEKSYMPFQIISVTYLMSMGVFTRLKFET